MIYKFISDPNLWCHKSLLFFYCSQSLRRALTVITRAFNVGSSEKFFVFLYFCFSLLFVLSFTFKTQSFAHPQSNSPCTENFFESASHKSHSVEKLSDLHSSSFVDKDCHDETSQHCDCPLHALHCSHVGWPYTSDNSECPFITDLTNSFSFALVVFKPSPALDGPFQPPRN